MKSSPAQNITSLIVTLVLLVLLFVFVDRDRWTVFGGLKASHILISLAIATVIQTISGCMYYYARRQFGVSMEKKDVFLLPPVMGLWSFIMPVQGSMIFVMVFFKKKYNMDVTESLSINIYLYMLTLLFAGLVGLYIAAINNNLVSIYSLVCVLLVASPLALVFAKGIVKYEISFNNKILLKIKSFVESTIKNINSLWMDYGFLARIGILKIAHLGVSILWFYYLAYALGMNLLFSEVALISLVASAAHIIKITPGNLGTTQLAAGAFMALAGYSADQAIIITLFATATVMLLNFTIGLFGNYYYFKTIDIIGIQKNVESQNG